MNNMQALGYVMDYCNRNLGNPEITQEKFNKWKNDILCSPEGRFTDCANATAVIWVLENE